MSDPNVFDDATAADLVAIVRYYRRNGLLPARASGTPFIDSQPTPYYFHNAAGEEIPAYACMQITGTEEIGGQNFLVVEKPADTDGTAGAFIFNGPHAVADDEEGTAQRGQIVRAFKDTGTVTGGDKWSPVASQWYIAKVAGGPFTACGLDDVDDDVLRVVLEASAASSSATILAVTPSGGIPARTGSSAPYTWGAATCDLIDPSTGDVYSPNRQKEINNMVPVAISGSRLIQAKKIGEDYFIDVDSCPAS